MPQSWHRTSQDGTPPETPGLLNTSAHQVGLSPYRGPRATEKVLHLLRPPSPRLRHLTQPTGLCGCVPSTRGMCGPSFPQRHPVVPITVWLRPENAGIHCQLRASEAGLFVNHAWMDQVQVSDRHIPNGDSPTLLPDRPHPRPAETPARALPAQWWPQRVKLTATPAGTRT